MSNTVNRLPHLRRKTAIFTKPLRALAAAAAFGFVPAVSRAEELPPPLPSAAVAGVESDGFLLKKVNAAFAADPTLARVDLTVSVVDRVAVVGGPVPDSATISRVEVVAKGVPGLAAVKVMCWSVAPAATDPFADRLAERLKGDPEAVPVVPRAVAVNSPLPPLAHGSPLGTKAEAVAEGPSLPNAPAPRVAAKVAMEHPGTISPADGFLLDPVAVPRRSGVKGVASTVAPQPAVPAYPTIPPQAVPVLPVSGVKGTADRVAEARASDPRFAKLGVKLADGTAVVAGRGRDAWAFAEVLRSVPGVTRVIVRDVQ